MIDPRAYIPLNWGMMSNGYNWIILIMMVAIAGMGLALVFPTAVATPGAQK